MSGALTHTPRWTVSIIITGQKILLCSNGRSLMKNISDCWGRRQSPATVQMIATLFFPGLAKDKFASSRTIQNVVANMTNLTSLLEKGSSLLEHLSKHYMFCFPFPIFHCMLSHSHAAGMATAEYPWLTHTLNFQVRIYELSLMISHRGMVDISAENHYLLSISSYKICEKP